MDNFALHFSPRHHSTSNDSSVRGDLAMGLIRSIANATDSVPIVGQAANKVLVLAETVETMRANRESFRVIVKEASSMVFSLSRFRSSVPETSLTMGYFRAMQTFGDTLDEVCIFASRSANRKWWGRLIRLQSDAGKISEYRMKLNHAFQLFNIEQNQAIFSLTLRTHEFLERFLARNLEAAV
ncbi:hypothetical protein BDN72DRAFT_897851 [Pluteus cervinus]|uniref:Uncharacterized protein n=1 Tax=Pluteus cervinus TaxID=181527 RepID=A0ACD3ASV2_9AGAR|nr:hypothetical protein BDN72DRAFT_897851 [Pluteus cervinus]